MIEGNSTHGFKNLETAFGQELSGNSFISTSRQTKTLIEPYGDIKRGTGDSGLVLNLLALPCQTDSTPRGVALLQRYAFRPHHHP